MARYIDVIEAEAAIKDLFADMPRIEFMGNRRRWREENEQYLRCLDAIRSVPTADAVEIKKDGEWEMFDLISSAYYGKRMYFKQDDGTVYSRYSCKYMSVYEAMREFVSLIDDSDLPDVKAHWDKVEVRSGEWWHTCSKCKATWGSEDGDLDFNFCPNCGAQMREGREDERAMG